MRAFYEQNKKVINQLLLFALTLLAVYIFFKYMLTFFFPFILAFALSLIIARPVGFISEKSHMPRGLATALSMIIILSGLVLVVYIIVEILLEQIISFSVNFPSTYERALDIYHSFQQSYITFFNIFPEDIRLFVDNSIITIIPSITAYIGKTARALSVGFVTGLPKFFVVMIITIISTFFMTKDRQLITEFFRKQLPQGFRNTYTVMKQGIFDALFGYIRAQLIIMSFSCVIAVTGLTILRYEYSLLLGLVIAFFDALPIFGPGFVIWPWAAYSLVTGNYHFSIGLLVIYGCIMICRQFLEPKVLSSQVGLYPVVTLFSMYVGLKLFGPLGFIIGPVFIVIVKTLQKAGMLPDWRS